MVLVHGEKQLSLFFWTISISLMGDTPSTGTSLGEVLIQFCPFAQTPTAALTLGNTRIQRRRK